MKTKKSGRPRMTPRRWTVCAIILAFLVICVVLALVKPSMDNLTERISEDMIEGAGEMYSQTEYNYLIFNISRGRNVRTAVSETYMGIAGRIIQMDSGFKGKFANVLFWIPALLSGARITIMLTIVSMLAGVFFSIFLAIGKISKLKIISKPCSAYIFFFRGTPLLMQLFFVYYAFPMISPSLTINDKFTAAFVAFALNNAAYCAEIIRAAIQSIDKGQFEVSHALGLTYAQTMGLVIIPQSFRRLIPPVANEFIMVLKDVSLVSLIALSDLTHTTRSINSSSSSALVFVPAMVIYLIITAFFTFVFNRLEKKFSVYQ